jgi:hypothetical protein
MKKTALIITSISLSIAGLLTTHQVWAKPSSYFNETPDGVYDDWGIYRTRAFGQDGFYQLSEASFRPAIVFESLGEEIDLAYSLGEQIAADYPNDNRRAEEIFRFVRDQVHYTPDIDQFQYDEFAQNADELATRIRQDGTGQGDCEDSAALLAVMFRGAGLRSAIALAEEHTAAMVYLPEYEKATTIFDLDGESGWLWAEATGKNNPLGWVPKEFIGTTLAAYEIGEEEVGSKEPILPSTAISPGESSHTSSFRPPVFLIVIGMLSITTLFRRRRRRAR